MISQRGRTPPLGTKTCPPPMKIKRLFAPSHRDGFHRHPQSSREGEAEHRAGCTCYAVDKWLLLLPRFPSDSLMLCQDFKVKIPAEERGTRHDKSQHACRGHRQRDCFCKAELAVRGCKSKSPHPAYRTSQPQTTSESQAQKDLT